MEHESWLQDFLLFFAAAGLVVPLFHRARLGAVLGFLLVGIAVGPYGFGRLAADYPWLGYLVIEDRERVEPFAELGVMFLLFVVGLELSLPRLWSMRRLVLGMGGMQVAISATAIAVAAVLFGVPGEPAIVVGLALAMSSTAIVIQLLEEQGRSATPVGRLALAVLLFQDLMVAPALVVSGALTRGGDDLPWALGLAVLQAAVAIGVIIGLGRFVLRPLLRFTATTGSREAIVAIAVLIVVAVAAATGVAGLSTALGAFLAGLLLAETEYRHHLEVDLGPFKGLLLGVFFVSVGMSLDLTVVRANLLTIVACVAGILLLKAAILFGAARAFKCQRAASAELALLLAQAGEFAFILIAQARGTGVLTPEASHFLTAMAVLSMVVTPFLALVARRIGERLESSERAARHPTPAADEFSDHVVIGGFGRVGQMVARLLEAEHLSYVALDTNAETVAAYGKRGIGRVYFGDASRAELLERVGLRKARAVVVTLDSAGAAERMIAGVRRVNPEVLIFARAKDAGHARRLLEAGAQEVIPEAIESSLQLGARVLEHLGVPDEAAEERIDVARRAALSRVEDATQGS
ncbi:MAG TPA: cation:proton antiporter [Xanthobacteraceae bacterium]|nr:cation:proton antiporter [Xanthobacteraceae bacterium]